MTEFRFPIPRAERLTLLIGASAAVGVLLALLVILRNFAAGANLSLGEFFAREPALRLQFAALCAVNVIALYALASFVRSKSSAILVIGSEFVRFTRRGAFGLPIGAADVTMTCSDVDVLRAQRVRRGSVVRVEAEILAGRETIRVNLEHASPGLPITTSNSATWLAHPLMKALESASETTATVL
ncbi:MAG: hypothetical protein ACI81R_001929 [Bradymonadia bacterium]|jgi:hypothetical protein